MNPYEGWLPSSPHLTQEEALRQSLLGQYMALNFPVAGLEAVNARADAKLGAETVIEIRYMLGRMQAAGLDCKSSVG